MLLDGEQISANGSVQQIYEATGIIKEWEAVMEIKLINNHTDKQYIFKSENNYGLGIKYYHDGRTLSIHQHECHYQKEPTRFLCQLSGFSIIEITRKKFKI